MANLVSWEFTQLPTDVIDILEKENRENFLEQMLR